MPPLPQPRVGKRLETLRRPTEFSFWPTRRLRAHAKVQPTIFVLDPWLLIKDVVTRTCQNSRKAEALACLEQARDFFVAGTEQGIEAARPLALYYSYMNLTKTLCLTHGAAQSFDQAQHGLTEVRGANGVTGLDSSSLRAFPSPNAPHIPQRLQNFNELKTTITGRGIQAPSTYELKHILPQVLPGHRLWAQAANERERFVSFQDIQFWYNSGTHQVWLRLYLFAHDLSRLSVTHRDFLVHSALQTNFREVACNRTIDSRPLICFELTQPETYPANHPADVLNRIVGMIKPYLWATVATVPPYRRYYAYLCPPRERNSLLPQLLSIYALTYYLGSVTRYRPQDFSGFLKGKFGPRIQDFVTGQPLQFLYLMASEIAQQDITKPSIL